MKRTTWFLAGTAAGAYVMSRMRRASESLTYDGITDRLAGLYAGARVLGEEISAATAEKEAELRRRLGLGHNGDHVIEVFDRDDDAPPAGALDGTLRPVPNERGND